MPMRPHPVRGNELRCWRGRVCGAGLAFANRLSEPTNRAKKIHKFGLYFAGAFNLSKRDPLTELVSRHGLCVCRPLPLQPEKATIFRRTQTFAAQQVS